MWKSLWAKVYPIISHETFIYDTVLYLEGLLYYIIICQFIGLKLSDIAHIKLTECGKNVWVKFLTLEEVPRFLGCL